MLTEEEQVSVMAAPQLPGAASALPTSPPHSDVASFKPLKRSASLPVRGGAADSLRGQGGELTSARSSAAPANGRRSFRDAGPMDMCYLCKQMGHWKRDCPHLNDPDFKPGDDVASNDKPIPSNIDLTIPGIWEAWTWFQRVDEDKSGVLDLGEVGELGKQLGLNWSKSQLKHAFDEMADSTGFYKDENTLKVEGGSPMEHGVTFQLFAQWWARHTAIKRRNMRRTVRELFDSADTSRNGVLDREEFTRLVQKANSSSSLPFILGGKVFDKSAEDEAWNDIPKVPFSEGTRFGINFAGFEEWWKFKAGISDPDIPVLPEYMVSQISEKVEALSAWNAAKTGQVDKLSSWQVMREKVLQVVRMQSQWGSLWNIYETRTESVYEDTELPKWIRDPDSAMSTCWDLSQLVFLLYVTVTVPTRACFAYRVELWSAAFWVDVIVDLYFVVDVVLNFRTSFIDVNGFREYRPAKIAKHYMKGWFLIDLVSCLPVGYIQFFVETDGDGNGGSFKGVKALRLMKMTKMLRLARLKRILSRHGSDVNYQQFFNVGLTVFTILLVVHLLACLFYLVGEGDPEELGNGVLVDGWVPQQTDWWTQPDGTNKTISKPDPRISVGVRYARAMYYVLNSLEAGYTTLELSFAIIADFTRDIILGLVASVITTISMSVSSSDNEMNLKLTRLKVWMKARKLPKNFQKNAMQYFGERWSTQGVDVRTLAMECPPAMASNMTYLIYGRIISTIPIFRGLSREVITALCLRCHSLVAMKLQTIIRQGEPGTEMYIVMSGEMEVLIYDDLTNSQEQRLGFLSEGAFFGEAPVLAAKGDTFMQLRKRTVRAVTTSELCFLTRGDVGKVCDDYPELLARILRFRNSSRVMNDKTLNSMHMNRAMLEEQARICKSCVITLLTPCLPNNWSAPLAIVGMINI